MDPELIAPENTAELDALLRAGVQQALATTDFIAAFAAFREELPQLAPQLAEMMPPESERAIAFALFREIWNHLPRPEHDWMPLPLPKAERNSVCPCGSGRKYKQCCGQMGGASPFGAGDFSVLAYVLETVPVAQYKNLPFKKLAPEELAHVAELWLTDGRDDAAAALLEPMLAPAAKLDGRHEYAFDVLCDTYLELDEPEKRLALVERLMQVSDRDLKSAAMHRRCSMLADAGDYPAAWALFKEAQRQDPDNPALAHLEVILLAGQGEIERAQECAHAWAVRLRKQGYAGEEIVAYLDEIARNPQVLHEILDGSEREEAFVAAPADVDALVALAEALPTPSRQHRLSPKDGAAGPLAADAALAALETEWDKIYWDEDAERDPWLDTRWIAWLGQHPLAWQSFVVLTDIVSTLEETLFPEGDDDRIDWLEETLLDHAVAVLRINIAENHAEHCTLAWGWLENRPALRLLMQLADLSTGSDEELPLLEWLLELNPEDSSGHRVALVHRLCEAGRAAAALAVCERFPDDALGGMRYGRVLALQQLERRGDATVALADASKNAPIILKTLVANNPRMPDLAPDGSVTAGGADEAWYYRVDFRQSWEKTGALGWLKQLAGSKD